MPQRWRYWIAIFFFGALAFLLTPADLFRPAAMSLGEHADETLLIILREGTPAEFTIPPGTERVVLDLVATLRPQRPYDPNRRIPLSLSVDGLWSGQTRGLHFDIETESRVSISDDLPSRTSLRGTHLRHSPFEATDTRRVELSLPAALSARGGRIRLQARGGPYHHLLVRGFARRAEGDQLERFQTLGGREFTLADRQDLADVGSALGPLDIPDDAWQSLLQRQSDRLLPVGTRGADFEVQTVILTRYRRPFTDSGRIEERTLFDCGPFRWAAFNTSGPGRFEVQGPVGTLIRVQEGLSSGAQRDPTDTIGSLPGSEPRVERPAPRAHGAVDHLRIGASRRVTLWRTQSGPSTMALSCPEGRTRLRLSNLGEDTQVGDVAPLLDPHTSSRFVLPDFRHSRSLQLRPHRSLVITESERPRRLRLMLRASLPESSAGGEVDAYYVLLRGESPASVQALRGYRRRARFERFDSGDALTEALIVPLTLPAHTRLEVRGGTDHWLRVVAQTEADSTLARPYRLGAPSNISTRWRYAPKDLRSWVWVLPEDFDLLVRQGRMRRVTQQVRLEARQGAGRAVADGSARRPSLPITDAGATDAGATDAGATDAGATDANTVALLAFQPSDSSPPTLALQEAQQSVEPATPAHSSPRRQARRTYQRRLSSEGTPLRARVAQRARMAHSSQNTPFPNSALSEITSQRQLWVSENGPSPNILLRPSRDALGGILSVWSSRTLLWQGRLRSGAERIALTLDPGRHLIRVEGLGDGVAFANLRPSSGPIVRLRSFELASDSPLFYRFPCQAGENQSVLFQVLSEEAGQHYELDLVMTQDNGRGRQQTQTTGRRGVARADDTYRLWDREEGSVLGSARARLTPRAPRGDQLRTLQVRSTGTTPLWLRVILASDRPPRQEER